MNKVIVLTEGGINIGYGHMTRCLSLSHAINQLGVNTLFFVNTDNTTDCFLDGNCRIFNWINNIDEMCNILKSTKPDLVIIDSYLANLDVYNLVFKTVKKCLYLDDMNRLFYPPGAILNGNIYAENVSYTRTQDHHYLMGCKYTPLRKCFWTSCSRKNKQDVTDLLIMCGGTDRTDFIKTLIATLLDIYPAVSYHVVASPGNIEEFTPRNNVNFYTGLSCNKILNLMLRSDICLSAGGQTLYELARTGTPTIGFCLETNQLYNLEGFDSEDLIHYAGWYNKDDIFLTIMNKLNKTWSFDDRQGISSSATSVVDGLGAMRVAEFLKDYV